MTRRTARPDGPGRLADVALRRRCFVIDLEDGSSVRVQLTRAMTAAEVESFKAMAAGVRKALLAKTTGQEARRTKTS